MALKTRTLAYSAFFAVLPVMVGIGCGGSGGVSSEVVKSRTEQVPFKGRVTFQGEPLISGTIKAQNRDTDAEYDGKISADGTYSINLIAGDYRVAISGETSSFSALPPELARVMSTTLIYEFAKDKGDVNIDIVLPGEEGEELAE